ncbi:nephrin [Caerostris darwini]|uniref:Nephrin n=1 Tax=Caerostris darwini TaxID=1538125 RepID=A0AAV4SEK8_9ARAC|nr:nephrin [Caerostris darwini]
MFNAIVTHICLSLQDPDTKSFSCYAVSEALGETIVQTYTVAVVHPPSSPTISGYEKGKPIKAGDLQKLSCVSTGGNPPANLKWFKNDKELSALRSSLQYETLIVSIGFRFSS